MKYLVKCYSIYFDEFVKKTFNDKDKAVEYAKELSLKHPKWKIRVIKDNSVFF